MPSSPRARRHSPLPRRARDGPRLDAAARRGAWPRRHRPRRWRGAILKADTEVRFRVLDPYKRPVSVTADSHEIRDVVRRAREQGLTMRDIAVLLNVTPQRVAQLCD